MVTLAGLNTYSGVLTSGDHPAAEAMFIGVGVKREDFGRPQIGILSTGWEGNTCNMHLLDLGLKVKEGMKDAGLIGTVVDSTFPRSTGLR